MKERSEPYNLILVDKVLNRIAIVSEIKVNDETVIEKVHDAL